MNMQNYKKKGYSRAAANAFGAGSDLVGKICNGQKVVSASRKEMTLEDGSKVDRRGAKVYFIPPPHDPTLVYCRRCKQWICECP